MTQYVVIDGTLRFPFTFRPETQERSLKSALQLVNLFRAQGIEGVRLVKEAWKGGRAVESLDVELVYRGEK